MQVPTTAETWRFEYGSRLHGNAAWIDLIQLLAIDYDSDPDVAADSRRVVEIANGYAAAGAGPLVELLSGGDLPLWNVTTGLMYSLEADGD